MNERAMGALARASKLRARFWASIIAIFSRGLTSFTSTDAAPKPTPLGRPVQLPDGPLIVVANHSSHADSVALLATLGRTRPVLVVSASDYWQKDSTADWVSRGLVGTFAISRSGDGMAQLRGAADLVRAGVVLVVFAEGTRSTTGEIGEFHTGAFRLAAEIGARVLPIAINGTFESLPKGATFPKHRATNLRHGTAIAVHPNAIDEAVATVRHELIDLHKLPIEDLPGFGWQRVRKAAFGWAGLLVVFLWAMGEGIFWPLIAEMPLLLLVVTVGWRWRGAALIGASAAGAALGVLATWWMVKNGFEPPSPLTTPRMFEVAAEQLDANLGGAFWQQMFNGIPVKVYAHEAGAMGLSLAEIGTALVARITRIVLVGAGGWLLGNFLARWLRPSLGLVQSVTLALFPFGLWLTIAYWS
jgi:1-acyl-sn-glycerol-3-phosphate acyltransferase